MRRMPPAVPLLPVVVLLGCARGADPWPDRPAYLGDPRVVAQGGEQSAPPPDAVPQQQARAGNARGRSILLRSGGGRAEARETALRFARALLNDDPAGLSALLSGRVAQTLDGTWRARDELIEVCRQEIRAATYATERDLTRVFDLGAIRVEHADAHRTHGAPAGIAATDLAVSLPARDPSGEGRRRLPCLDTLYVRTGRHSLVVGIAR